MTTPSSAAPLLSTVVRSTVDVGRVDDNQLLMSAGLRSRRSVSCLVVVVVGCLTGDVLRRFRVYVGLLVPLPVTTVVMMVDTPSQNLTSIGVELSCCCRRVCSSAAQQCYYSERIRFRFGTNFDVLELSSVLSRRHVHLSSFKTMKNLFPLPPCYSRLL